MRSDPKALHSKPTQNAFVESFNGHLEDECRNEVLFTSMQKARAELEQ
jgi:putative transposase